MFDFSGSIAASGNMAVRLALFRTYPRDSRFNSIERTLHSLFDAALPSEDWSRIMRENMEYGWSAAICAEREARVAGWAIINFDSGQIEMLWVDGGNSSDEICRHLYGSARVLLANPHPTCTLLAKSRAAFDLTAATERLSYSPGINRKLITAEPDRDKTINYPLSQRQWFARLSARLAKDDQPREVSVA